MKNVSQKNRLKWTLKIVDIDSEKLSEGLGRCPKNLQGTCPLTHMRALPAPVLAGRQEKAQLSLFCWNRMNRKSYVNRLSRHILTTWRRLRYSTFLLTTAPLLLGSAVFLHVQNTLPAEKDKKLPFGTIVFIEEMFRGITARAGTAVLDITFWPASDRVDCFTITFFVVRDQFLVSPALTEVSDQGGARQSWTSGTLENGNHQRPIVSEGYTYR